MADDSSRWAGGKILGAFRSWERRRAEKILDVPAGHKRYLMPPIDDGFDGEPVRDLRELARFMKAGRFHSEVLTTRYEQYWSRAYSQGHEWQDNARTAYELFESEVWVYACCRARMDAIRSVVGEFYAYDDDQDNRDERRPYRNYATDQLLDEPNPHQTWYDLVEEWEAYSALTGMALFDIGDRLPGGRRINTLWSIQPDALYPVGDSANLITGWTYEDAYGQTRPVKTDSIAWSRHFRPAMARLGMGHVQPAGQAADELQSIREWSSNFFANNAEPNGWIEVPKRLGGALLSMMRGEWRKIHTPGSNEPAILTGGASYHDGKSASGREGDFIEARKMAMVEVMAAFGTPPVVLGVTENVNYATADQQQQTFWGGTMRQELQRWDAFVTRHICPLLGGPPGLRYRSKIEEIAHIDPGRADREKGWREDVRVGAMSVEEYRNRRGYGDVVDDHTFLTPAGPLLQAPDEGSTVDPARPPADAGDKQSTALNGAQVESLLAIVDRVVAGQLSYRMGVAMLRELFSLPQPAAEATLADYAIVESPDDADVTQAADDDEPPDPTRGGGAPPADDAPPPPAAVESGPPAIGASRMTDERKASAQQEFHVRQREYMAEYINETRGIWEDVRDSILGKIDEPITLAFRSTAARVIRDHRVTGAGLHTAQRDIAKVLTVDDVLAALPPDEFAAIEAILNRHGVEVMARDGALVLRQMLGGSPGATISISDLVIADWAEHTRAVVGGIQTTIGRELTAQIVRGVTEGEGLRDLRQRVESVFERFGTSSTPSHAAMVARTEAHAAQNYGSLEGYAIGGAKGKEWLPMPPGSSISGKERIGHQEAAGQVQQLRDPFMVLDDSLGTEVPLQFPGDPSAPFSSTHNCRCTQIPVLP